MRPLALAVAFTALTALAALTGAPARAQDAVEIKPAAPKAGDRVKVTIDEKAQTKTLITIKGMEQKKDEMRVKSIVYVEEVLEVKAGDRRPSKAKRTYEKAAAGPDGQAQALALEGKTVTIEKKGVSPCT
ncbi:MAG: hypothetical protein K2V38_28035, partial [Gemmataceae bacterium]|nr:hypothetical protein [Gemmataceae bacterium]